MELSLLHKFTVNNSYGKLPFVDVIYLFVAQIFLKHYVHKNRLIQ